MKKYPKIEQFRSTIVNIKKHTSNQIVTFNITTKMHGTNAGIRINESGVLAQSRNRELSIDNDNMGFAKYVAQHEKEIQKLVGCYTGDITLFGEWVGPKITTGVSVNELPEKCFVLFNILVDDKWVSMDLGNTPILENQEINMFDVRKYFYEQIDIDFNNTNNAAIHITELTNKIEEECPVGKALKKVFNIAGSNTTGEGVVVSTVINGVLINFKSKGDKHSVSKVKKLNAISPEKLESIGAFVEYAATDNRINQMINEVCPDGKYTPALLGKIIASVSRDIIAEESDVLKESNLTMKDCGRPIAKRVRDYYFLLCEV